MPPTTIPLHTPTSPEDLIQQTFRQNPILARKSEEVAIRTTGKLMKFSCDTAAVLDSFITVDPDMLRLKEKVQILQAQDEPVLIIGPSGTGKELIARALHGSRVLLGGAFVGINCTSMPDQLLESELFGHKKGAFTGADVDRVGKFGAAFNGTLFLDEIGDMPINMQAKLLRVLQEREYYPIGSEKRCEVKCRIIAATNNENIADPRQFRSDLFYRLNVFVLRTKPLAQRLCDVEKIVNYLGGEKLLNEFEKFKEKDSTKNQIRLIKKAHEDAKQLVEGPVIESASPLSLRFPTQGHFELASVSLEDAIEDQLYKMFFSLEGNVRSLASQVKRFNVLGEI